MSQVFPTLKGGVGESTIGEFVHVVVDGIVVISGTVVVDAM
jgi:hypothetical protein